MYRHSDNFARYLPVNEEALRWGIFCNDAGYANVPPGAHYPPNPGQHPRLYAATVATGRILREFQVVYITAGSGWFNDKINGEREISEGDLFILFPGVWHSYRPDPRTGWQEYWVGFSGFHAERLYKNGLFNPNNPIHRIGLSQEVVDDYERIVKLCRDQTPGFQVLLGSLVLQLLAHTHVSELSLKVEHSDRELVSTARTIMQRYLESGIEITRLADELGIGYTYMLNIFRQYTGLTPYQYFLQMRIHRAKEMLLDPELSVKTVSANLHFENQYYFSRLFKKKTGFSPSEWKKGHTQAHEDSFPVE